MRIEPVWLGQLLEGVVPEVLCGTDGLPARARTTEPGSAAELPDGVAAQVLLQLEQGGALRLALRLPAPLARRLSQAAGDGITDADLAAEWINLVGGRLAMRLAESGASVRLGLPGAATAVTASAIPPRWTLQRQWTCDGQPLLVMLEAFNT